MALALIPAAPAAAETATEYTAIATGLAIPASAARVDGRLGAQAIGQRRSVLVDAASATLYMMEAGRIVDSMKVIVGKPEAATPELRTTLSYATLNPYWHVPANLARTIVAPNVLKYGAGYLQDRGYQVLSSFGPDAREIDPGEIDWKAVQAGTVPVFVRQLPGPGNSMGKMKFNLANSDGIYLHDTPKKELFAQDNRSLSAGCVRLEDAPRLARWLLGSDPQVQGMAPEQHVALPRSVPVVITYLDTSAQSQLALLR